MYHTLLVLSGPSSTRVPYSWVLGVNIRLLEAGGGTHRSPVKELPTGFIAHHPHTEYRHCLLHTEPSLRPRVFKTFSQNRGGCPQGWLPFGLRSGFPKVVGCLSSFGTAVAASWTRATWLPTFNASFLVAEPKDFRELRRSLKSLPSHHL